MTCTRCASLGPTTLSAYDAAPARLCADCRRLAAREMLASLVERYGYMHMAARLRGERCAVACATCDAERRAA